MLKRRKELEQLPDQSTDIEADNTINRYARRHKALENYCLADFVSKLVSVSKVVRKAGHMCETDVTESYANDTIDVEDNDHENVTFDSTKTAQVPKARFSVINGDFKIVLRTKPKILRYVKYNEKVDSENYYREQLMLFYPWRNEEKDLMNGCNTYKDHFLTIEKQVLSKKHEYDANSELIDNIETAAGTQTIDNFDEVSPNIESVETNDSQNDPIPSTKYAFYRPETREHAYYDLGVELGLTTNFEYEGTEIIQSRLPQRDYLEMLSRLNKEQREIFTHILHSLTFNPSEQLCVFITGGAGVGKSVLICTLYQALLRQMCSQSGENPEDTRILLCAYTGLAAYNIKGSTLHAAFCIEPNKKLTYKQLSDDKRNTLRTKYMQLSVLIVDEVSMVGSEMLNFLYLRLQEIKGNRRPFGGVHIILVGDLYQLRPVGDSWIFANNSCNYTSLGPNLWQTHFSMFELTEIMRQKDDTPFAELLNRIREGNHTEEDLTILKSRSILSIDSKYQELKNELHLFPCNTAVDSHNQSMFESISTEKAEISCIDTVLGEDTENIKQRILDQLKGKKINNTGNLSENLQVAVGLCYDTTHNVSVSDGICNGTPCVLKKIHYMEKQKSVPSCLWVEFLEESVGRNTRKEYSHYYKKYPEISKEWTPIWFVKRTFIFRQKAIVRQQFPLKASSAKTIHKAQGQTKTCIIVDMSSGSRPHHHYVAFSRVPRLQGLYLLNGLSDQIKVDKSVVQELKRLCREACIKLSYKPVSSYGCDLTTVFQNVQSLPLHFPLVRSDCTFTDSDIICLAETRLYNNDRDADYSINGFLPIIRNDQLYTLHGMRPPHGLAVYVKECHQIVCSKAISTDKFEGLVVGIITRSLKLYTIIVVYKAPKCTFEDFKSYIGSLLTFQLFDKLIIVGDFNFDLSKDRNRMFLQFMKSVFPKANMLNTGSTTQENTILDVCFTTCVRASAGIISCVWSYHHTLVVSV